MELNVDSDSRRPSDLDYHYAPLTQPNSIRLLHLYPASSDSEDLNDKLSYDATSYCWGDPNDIRVVFCDHRALHVTVSLYTALKRLRYADQDRILWADAVCINQKDNDEKGRQVQLMSRIYSQPTRVLICLGDDMTGLDGLTGCLRSAREVLPPETHDYGVLYENSKEILLEGHRLPKEGKPNLLDYNWAPMKNLLCRPCFDRRWIIQEVVLANDNDAAQPLVSYTIRRQLFQPGADEKIPIRVSEDGDGRLVLHLRGRVVDRIEEIASC
ncbi:heterokaryon incompatibility protein-domain-containing protein [Achaetomium macrosporum]|uniref:Heterokaryon incompatibility protein-domain-containing protein n=1 Tax=Achaetomium macrosporum TaxID=79813 RepID=A0AAN7HCI5_9PEZI|nr:heterokaryon incompatibility protein-domain-containing protein [Achaetomium macrosporum]